MLMKRRWILTLLCGLALISAASAEQPTTGPQRIIALSPALVELVYAIGAGDQVAGISSFTVHPPEALEKPECGGLFDPNLERILALKPDLVLMQGKMDKLERLCRQRSIPAEQCRIETIADVRRTLRRLSVLTGQRKGAERVVAQLDEELDALKELREKHSVKTKVFIALSRKENSLSGIMTGGGDTFIHELVELAGGENIFAGQKRYPSISKESLLTRRPDVILELRPGEELTPERRDALLHDWDTLSTLPAVRNGRIVFLTGDAVLMPTPRVTGTIRRIHAMLYPEAVTDQPAEAGAKSEAGESASGGGHAAP